MLYTRFDNNSLRDDPNYKLLTVRSILSHQAGLPNWFKPGEQEEYVSKAGTRFDYSGLGYCFLNEVIEHVSGQSLHELSQTAFCNEPLKMSSSSFVPHEEGTLKREARAIGHDLNEVPDEREHFPRDQRPNPAASLFTTAEDYAKFLTVCTTDPFIRKHMFEPQVKLVGKDSKAMEAGVPPDTLAHMNWGLGMGLQTNENGETIAFHWGDVETCRSFAAINLKTNRSVACFTNSANGPSVFQQIAEPVVGSLTPVSQWLSRREGLVFAEDRMSTDVQLTPTSKITTESSTPFIPALQKIIESAHIPAVGYACVEPQEEGKRGFASTSLTFGKKNAQSTDAENNIDAHTRFPAASLSKIVFTYLVLQLVKEGYLNLDTPLHDTLQYERFKINGEYPAKAIQLTARHVLSHTTGLPNVGSDLFSTLSFNLDSKLGETYAYSGEAFIYLQSA